MTTHFKCVLPDCEHDYGTRPPSQPDIMLHQVCSHRGGVRIVEVKPESPEEKYVTSVGPTIAAMRVVWASEQGQNDTVDEYIAVAHALTEVVITLNGLPHDCAALRTRELIYKAIVGFPSVREWFNS